MHTRKSKPHSKKALHSTKPHHRSVDISFRPNSLPTRILRVYISLLFLFSYCIPYLTQATHTHTYTQTAAQALHDRQKGTAWLYPTLPYLRSFSLCTGCKTPPPPSLHRTAPTSAATQSCLVLSYFAVSSTVRKTTATNNRLHSLFFFFL